MEPIVSVIITTFERPRYLGEAIKSVLAQDFRDFELIIVDDASEDNKTEDIIKTYINKDERVKYIKNNEHLGSTKSLNIGLKSAKGKYVAILDDDDAWIYKGKLTSQVKFLEESRGYVLIGTNIIAISADSGKEIRKSAYALSDDKIRKTIFSDNPFAHSSVLYSKEKVSSVGGYDESLARGKDYDMWFRLGKIGKMAVLPDYWVKYRVAVSSQRKILEMKKQDSSAKLTVMKRYSADYPDFLRHYLIEWIRYYVFSVLSILQKIINLNKTK